MTPETLSSGKSWIVRGESLGVKMRKGVCGPYRTPNDVRAFLSRYPGMVIESIEEHRGGVVEAKRVYTHAIIEEGKLAKKDENVSKLLRNLRGGNRNIAIL
jgi:hypothetical protein